MAGRGSVAELFAPLLPERARFAARAIAGEAPPLFPEEEVAVRTAHERRRRPFAFGRACAREALGRDVAIAMGPNRQPMWPSDVIGSITHTDEHAAAVVIDRVEALRSIGIDLESLAHAAATPDLLTMVATPAERARTPPVDAKHFAALVFSAKESVYKCLYPLTGRFLDFHDVELHFEGDCFIGHGVRGRFAIDDVHVATVAST